MIINLIDWKNEKHPVDIGDLNNIKTAAIHVVTGDEILNVLYKDDTEKVFDSSEDRMEDFDNGAYMLYAFGDWFVDKDKFMNRETSYDLLNPEIMMSTYAKYMEEIRKAAKELGEKE